MKSLLSILLAALACCSVHAQQLPDRTYQPRIDKSAYAAGVGPPVCIDEAHFNFHTLDGRFWAFAELLRRLPRADDLSHSSARPRCSALRLQARTVDRRHECARR